MIGDGYNNVKVFNDGALTSMAKKIDKDSIISEDAEALIQKISEIFINDVCEAAYEDCKLRESNYLEPSDIFNILQERFDLLLPGDTGIFDEDMHAAKPLADYTEKLQEVRRYLSSHHDE